MRRAQTKYIVSQLCCATSVVSPDLNPCHFDMHTRSVISAMALHARFIGNGCRWGGASASHLSVICRLEPSCGARQFWNYQRRQLYVMDTYCNAHNRRLNHIMLALHCYLSWAFIIALVLTGLEVIALLMGRITGPEVSSGGADISLWIQAIVGLCHPHLISLQSVCSLTL